jgi:hypothetical protein
LQVDNQCFTNSDGGSALGTTPVDCALSDGQILSPTPGAAGASGAASATGASGAASAPSPKP